MGGVLRCALAVAALQNSPTARGSKVQPTRCAKQKSQKKIFEASSLLLKSGSNTSFCDSVSVFPVRFSRSEAAEACEAAMNAAACSAVFSESHSLCRACILDCEELGAVTA